MMNVDSGNGSARWRRERRLRSMLRHERQSVAMELAAALHHSRGVGPDDTNNALQRQMLASSGMFLCYTWWNSWLARCLGTDPSAAHDSTGGGQRGVRNRTLPATCQAVALLGRCFGRRVDGETPSCSCTRKQATFGVFCARRTRGRLLATSTSVVLRRTANWSHVPTVTERGCSRPETVPKAARRQCGWRWSSLPKSWQ